MRLTRRGFRKNQNREPQELANKEFPEALPLHSSYRLPENVERSFNGKDFTLRIHGGDGRENSTDQYQYEITLSLKEIRFLLSRPFNSIAKDFPGGQEISKAEKQLWNTLFDQWEKRLRALARRERKIRENWSKQINK